jgi:hypothetical protein
MPAAIAPPPDGAMEHPMKHSKEQTLRRGPAAAEGGPAALRGRRRVIEAAMELGRGAG